MAGLLLLLLLALSQLASAASPLQRVAGHGAARLSAFCDHGLVSPSPTSQTQSLMCYLKSIHRQKMLSGQHIWELTYGGMTKDGQVDDLRRVRDITGKYPAIATWDFIFSSPHSSWVTDTGNVNNAIDWVKNKNGIVGFQWHWAIAAPGSGGEPSFYSKNTDFDVRRAVQSGTTENAWVLEDIDAVAGKLKQLQRQGVPVLWRPLHESGGGWFWWDRHGAAPTIALWKLMFDRMTRHHGLKNLIWVWNTEKVSADWYPGDDYCDVYSVDLYGSASDYPQKYFDFAEFIAGRKMVALAENGRLPSVADFGAAPWLYFGTWYGEYVSGSKSSSADEFRALYGSPLIVTRDELPTDLYTNGGGASGGSDPKTAIVCGSVKEGNLLELSCPFGVMHTLTYASYGRTPGCDRALLQHDCHSSKTAEVVGSKCLGRASCSVAASNDNFGNPCWFHTKRLTIQVACVDSGFVRSRSDQQTLDDTEADLAAYSGDTDRSQYVLFGVLVCAFALLAAIAALAVYARRRRQKQQQQQQTSYAKLRAPARA